MMDMDHVLVEINRFVKLAKKHCTYPNEHNLNKDEAATIYLYTMEMLENASVHHFLNESLRDENRAAVRPWFAYLKLFVSAASKLFDFKGVVWRVILKDVSHAIKRKYCQAFSP